MIIVERLTINGEDITYTYSDEKRYILRDGSQYTDAYDLARLNHIYTEGDLIPEDELLQENLEDKARSFDIIIGTKVNSDERACQLRTFIEQAVSTLSDNDALKASELFPHYQLDHEYEKDFRFLWPTNGKLYKVLQNHTSGAQWKPNEATSLYVEVTPPSVIPVWKQPTGSVDSYMTGDKVYFPTENDLIYISTMDYNVYAPNVYGWELYNGG